MLLAALPILTLAAPQDASASPAVPSDGFHRVVRSGAVDLEAEFDLTGLTVPEGEIHRLLPRDAIPALVDPPLVAAAEAAFPAPDGRLVLVELGQARVAVPVGLLDFHEVANLTVAGHPIAVTW